MTALEAAQENLELLNEGYRAGKVDFLQLLLIRRETLDARREYIDTLEEWHSAEADLARLTAGRADRLRPPRAVSNRAGPGISSSNPGRAPGPVDCGHRADPPDNCPHLDVWIRARRSMRGAGDRM